MRPLLWLAQAWSMGSFKVISRRVLRFEGSKASRMSRAFDRARKYAQALEDRDGQDRKYGLLLFLLFMSLASFLIYIAARMR